MRPILFTIDAPSLTVTVGLWLLIAAAVAVWLGMLHRRKTLNSDAWTTGVGVALVAAVMLGLLRGIGELRVNAYGTMLITGFLLGIFTATRLGKRRGVPTERIFDLGMIILVGAILGARLLYMILTPNAGPFLDLSTIAREGLGGLSFHGGLIGGFLAGTGYIVINKLSFWRVADCVAPGIMLGYAITRIGCFLNGCCYGKPTNVPWAMTFPHSPDGLVAHVHPTQLYASVIAFAFFGVLVWLSRGNGLHRAGRLFMAFLMLEGVERFVMEIFRHPDPNYTGPLTPAMAFSVLLILGGIVGWFALPKRPAVDAPTESNDRPPVATR